MQNEKNSAKFKDSHCLLGDVHPQHRIHHVGNEIFLEGNPCQGQVLLPLPDNGFSGGRVERAAVTAKPDMMDCNFPGFLSKFRRYQIIEFDIETLEADISISMLNT